jgi:hypothetical protein
MTVLYGIYLIADFMQALYRDLERRNYLQTHMLRRKQPKHDSPRGAAHSVLHFRFPATVLAHRLNLAQKATSIARPSNTTFRTASPNFTSMSLRPGASIRDPCASSNFKIRRASFHRI